MDDLAAHEIENLRRSIAMLRPRHPSGLDRERALMILERLQHLERTDRRYRLLVEQLHSLLTGLDAR